MTIQLRPGMKIKLALLLAAANLLAPSSDCRASERATPDACHKTLTEKKLRFESNKNTGDLGFTVNQLFTALKNSNAALKPSLEYKDTLFKIRLSSIKVTGCTRKKSHVISDVCVSGKGLEFNNCVEQVVKLASQNNGTAAEVLMKLKAHQIQQRSSELFFDKNGVRYHKLRILGVPIFHCTNAQADNRAILKAQPS